jgi:hypothetical protein
VKSLPTITCIRTIEVILISLDVKNMYPSIPIEDGLPESVKLHTIIFPHRL